MYKLIIKPILFLLPPEFAHNISLQILKWTCKIPFFKLMIIKSYQIKKNDTLIKKIFNLKFENPIGLAAGLDKNANFYNELALFGFSFIEIGTVTPKPQKGNSKKRLYRLKKDRAIINRMGFNNDGAIEIAKRLKKNNKQIIIGGNIGKNKNTPNENTTSDYIKCYEVLYDYVDYFAINISSPNTKNLRNLHNKEPLKNLLLSIQKINLNKKQPKPILLKIAPDLTKNQIIDIIDIVEYTKINGIIATNTTLNRETLTSANKIEQGGLSGNPLREKSTEVIRLISKLSNGTIPIIGVGGIHSPKDALEKLVAGASLIQLYTGLVYEGPALVKSILKELQK